MSPVQLVKASNPLTLACRQAYHSRICHGNMEVTLELSWTPLVLRRKQPRTNIKHIVHSFPQHLFWNYRYRQTKYIIVTCDPWLFKPPATRMLFKTFFQADNKEKLHITGSSWKEYEGIYTWTLGKTYQNQYHMLIIITLIMLINLFCKTEEQNGCAFKDT